MGKIFVRARPSKIALTETFYYKGSVGDNSSWEFKKAEGEIKIEFPYDGYYNGSFDENTRNDLRKQDPDGEAKNAITGHLAIANAGKSTWNNTSLEGKTIPVKIDVENIQEKLKSSQKYLIQFFYRPDEPENRPFHLGDIKLTDQEPFEGSFQSEHKPKYYPFLMLLMNFRTRMNEELRNVKELSHDQIKDLFKLVENGQTREIKPLPGNSTAEQICSALRNLANNDRGGILIIGLELDGEVSGLSAVDSQTIFTRISQAALIHELPIPILTPALKEVDDDKKVAVVVVPPIDRNRYERYQRERNKIIFSDSDLIFSDSDLTKVLVNELLEKGDSDTVFFQKDISDKLLLARAFASLANNREGYIVVGLEPKHNNYLYNDLDFAELYSYEQIASEALMSVNPLLGITCRKNQVRIERPDGRRVTVLVFHIASDLSEVYSVNNRCWEITDETPQEVISLEPEKVFQLFNERYHHFLQRAMVKGAPPKISYGRIRWPYNIFDGLDADDTVTYYDNSKNAYNFPGTSQAQFKVAELRYFPSKYDPLCGAMEWHNVPFVVNSYTPQFFEAALGLKIGNSEDLRDPDNDNALRDLEGRFEILLDQPVISGLEFIYFNALGEKLTKAQRDKIISQQTKIVLDITLRTSDLFKKRDFSPYRRLEFEEVLPEPARYEDIEEALYDCGLRIIPSPKNKGRAIQKDLSRSNIWLAEHRSETGKIIIWLRATNRWYGLQREISYGERTDKKSVPSGRITIEIVGEVEGAKNRELTSLINKLQTHLKERFKYVRVG